MLEIEQDIHQIFRQLKQHGRSVQLLNQLPQDRDYLKFLSLCDDQEITPDFVLFSDQKAYQENQYLAKYFPKLAEQVWMIARTGQGDEWFMDRCCLNILFYDHDLGEYQNFEQFQSLDIHFSQFLQLAWLLKNYENQLDHEEQQGGLCSTQVNVQLVKLINNIQSDLAENFPFSLG